MAIMSHSLYILSIIGLLLTNKSLSFRFRSFLQASSTSLVRRSHYMADIQTSSDNSLLNSDLSQNKVDIAPKPKRTVRIRSSSSITSTSASSSSMTTSKKPYLLPTPPSNSIGNFFEKDEERTSFIQCYMLGVCCINDTQYGIGYPMDMPVMLTYFEDNELKPVKPDYPSYDHLIQHVSNQLDANDMQLYTTPIVLTLQGEFNDEDMKSFYPREKGINEEYYAGDAYDDDEEDEEEDEEDDEEEDAELTLEQLLARDDDVEDDEDDDDEDDDDDNDEDEDYDEEDEEEDDLNADISSFWSSSPAGSPGSDYDNLPDYKLVPSTGDVTDIPEDAIVTDEDTKALRRAHRKADRIISYAEDLVLIASFHYKKKNYHLVKLVEPIVIIGKRIMDIKGYYFNLLGDEESAAVTPILDELMIKHANSPLPAPGDNHMDTDMPSGGRNKGESSRSTKNPRSGGNQVENETPSSKSNTGLKKSRRRWSNRLTDKE
jgi:hypothetical protein